MKNNSILFFIMGILIGAIVTALILKMPNDNNNMQDNPKMERKTNIVKNEEDMSGMKFENLTNDIKDGAENIGNKIENGIENMTDRVENNVDNIKNKVENTIQ